MWIVSFDIGLKNLAFTIENVDTKTLMNITNIPKKCRYNSDKTPTPAFKVILDKVCKDGTIVTTQHVDLTQINAKNPYIALTKVLDTYRLLLDECSIVIIEKQMGFQKILNIKAMLLAQHVASYFHILYADFKMVVNFCSSNKTKVMGVPKTTYNQRKQWSVKTAKDILVMRNDVHTLEMIDVLSKQDDVADSIVQLQAFKYMFFIDNKAF